ncbi:MAG: hypothetical protein HYZ81_00275 [Nitrospinae bacterium]|nr:hypothetical protein [Nitrospinota bacterium]
MSSLTRTGKDAKPRPPSDPLACYARLQDFAILCPPRDETAEGEGVDTHGLTPVGIYFFHSQTVAILAHALTKEGEIPDSDLERAIRRKRAFERDPAQHTYEGEVASG